jgi:GMP synthase (glutamine-hydrolysing)
MKVLIINNHTKRLKELESVFPGAVVVRREEVVSAMVSEFDLVLLSGGSDVPTVLNHNEVYEQEERLLQMGKPVIGICLGCEIICRAFGGELEQMPITQSGERQFQVQDRSLEERLGRTSLEAYEHHRVRIAKLPKDFSVIVSSEHGPEVIKHNQKPIVGVQFHPEVGSLEILWQWLKDIEGLH